MKDESGEAPLVEAMRVGREAAALGFDWPDVHGALAKIREELAELEAVIAAGADPTRRQEEFGDVLFSFVNVARHLDIDPQLALHGTTEKFRQRFAKVKDWAGLDHADQAPPTLDELEALWQRAKGEEPGR